MKYEYVEIIDKYGDILYNNAEDTDEAYVHAVGILCIVKKDNSFHYYSPSHWKEVHIKEKEEEL